MRMIISLIIIGVFLLVGARLVLGASWSGYVLEENVSIYKGRFNKRVSTLFTENKKGA